MARKTRVAGFIVALTSLSMLTCSAVYGQNEVPLGIREALAIHQLQREIEIATILQDLRPKERPGRTVFRNVSVVDPISGTVATGQSVAISNGRILWVESVDNERKFSGAAVIEGNGRYLGPGLTDMHTHTNRSSSWLLNLANGVTTIREMAGFPWLLSARQSVNARRMMAPTMYVAGPIISGFPLNGYAVVPTDTLDARRMVRQHAFCGYDFVKIHNVVARSILQAISDEAGVVNIDLVGHVPHDIGVREAVELGLRSQEHLKGFLDDKTLQLGDTDYQAAAIEGVWLTPTFYATIGFSERDVLQAIIDGPEVKYIPPEIRSAWTQSLSQPEPRNVDITRHGDRLARELIGPLADAGARFLAGTDADGQSFQVMGFALHHELQNMREAGLSNLDVLRSATSSPAEALGLAGSFGQIAAGHRADFVMLEENPITEISAYRNNVGVMVRGDWIERNAFDSALEKLAQLYTTASTRKTVKQAEADALVENARDLVDAGYVFPNPVITNAAAAMRAVGFQPAERGLLSLSHNPSSGACEISFQ